MNAAADFLLSDCPTRCPELDACINSSLWCDGHEHCPSGYDEMFTHCLKTAPTVILTIWGIASLIALIGSLAACYHVYQAEPDGTPIKSLPSDTEAIVGTPKEVIC